MKKALGFLLILLASLSVTAQETGDPGVQIVRVEIQRGIAKSPSMRAVAPTDPAARAAERADANREVDRNPALRRLSRDAEVAPATSRPSPFGNLPSPPQVVFIASIVVKNTGHKTITAIHWDYLMFKSGEPKPVQTYHVLSRHRIDAGEQAELTKEVRPKGNEQQAVITRVDYADGTSWKRPIK